MADENTSGATVAPAAQIDTAQAAPATTPAATESPQIQGDPNNPPWLPGRLKQAQDALLKELGITDAAKAKATLEAAAKAEQERLSIAERLTDTSSKLTTVSAEAERLRAITAEFAARQMVTLNAEQQTAVKAIAGEDPAAQLKAITALQPTWARGALPTTTPSAQPAPPPTGTAPAPNAPPSTTVAQPNHKEIHAQLSKTNPFAAASYALAHLHEVFPEPST